MKSCNEIGIQDVTELDIDNLANLPDYLLGLRDVVDEHSGDMVTIATRVPTERLVPNGNNDNVFILETNNPDLTVPEGQVVPAYVIPGTVSNTVSPANSAAHTFFLMLGAESGLARCQNTGVAFFPNGHAYSKTIGVQYYLSSAAGHVTTDSTQTGKKLFIPLDGYQLLINM